MWRSMIKVMAATAAFGLVHSALASRSTKRAAANRFGERNRNGLYRVFYLAQSAVTFGMLAAYIRRQPSKEVRCRFQPVSCIFTWATSPLSEPRMTPDGGAFSLENRGNWRS